MKQYLAKNGKQQFKPSWAELTRAIEDDDNTGFCLACGASQGGCEPDMRKGQCESCDAQKVYGAQELLVMNLYHSGGEPQADTPSLQDTAPAEHFTERGGE